MYYLKDYLHTNFSSYLILLISYFSSNNIWACIIFISQCKPKSLNTGEVMPYTIL